MKTSLHSLSAKLVLASGGTVAVVLVAAITLSALATKSRIEAMVFDQAKSEAKAVANFIDIDVGQAVASARTMADAIGAMHEAGMHDRKIVVELLKPAVQSTPSIFGSWFAEEPGGIDGVIDSKAPGANAEGIFTPYWTKGKNGGVDYSTFSAKYDAPWYEVAKRTGKGMITDPYLSDEGVTMTSVSFPAKSGGRMIGVAGIDIGLEDLSKSMAAMKPFGAGRVLLVTGDGNWIVSPDPAQRMKPYEDVGAADIKGVRPDGQPRVVGALPTGETRIAYPFSIPGVDTTWTALVDVPGEVLSAPVRAQILQLAAGGTLLLLLVIGILALGARIVVRRPLEGLLVDVETLAAGDYRKPVNGQEVRDEIGALARALEGFRHALASGRRAETVAEEERVRADVTRRESEAERIARADEQTRIVETLGASLKQLATGDLTCRLPTGRSGAFSRISDDFNAAVSQLEGTIAAVTGAVRNIDSGTGEISATAQEMARRIEGQAASLEETSAALGEITARVNQSAEFASGAAATVKTASKDAQASDTVVHQAIEAMRAIETSSKEIGKIIGVIDEIAFQTNLLALNAGVEAARAGEAGRGFAVVATEVRGLAQRSADAARQIKELISAASREVEEGVDLVEHAGESLRRIAAQVRDIDDKVLAIADGAREQSAGVREINTAVVHMDQATQQNAAMLEEAAAASEALRTEANELKSLVARFATNRTPSVPAHGLRRVA